MANKLQNLTGFSLCVNCLQQLQAELSSGQGRLLRATAGARHTYSLRRKVQ